MQKKRMFAAEIKRTYSEGRRNFSNIDASQNDFTNADLRGAIFTDSNLSFSYFRGANLGGADFTGANLEWSDFSRANIDGAKLVGANMAYCVYNDAIFGKADLSRADLSWSLLFRCDTSLCKTAGTNFYACSYRVEDITPEGIAKVRAMLFVLGKSLDAETRLSLQFAVNRTTDTFNAFNRAGEENADIKYGVKFGAGMKGYSVKEGAAADINIPGYGAKPVYIEKARYKKKSAYKTEE